MQEIESVRSGLAKTGMTAVALCALVNIAPSRLSDALKNFRPLDPAILRRMIEQIGRVERASILLKPLKLDFTNHAALRSFLDEVEYVSSEWPVLVDLLRLMRLLSGVTPETLADEAGRSLNEMRKELFDSGVKFQRAAESLKGIAAEIQNGQAQ